jgi:hypothetical protein
LHARVTVSIFPSIYRTIYLSVHLTTPSPINPSTLSIHPFYKKKLKTFHFLRSLFHIFVLVYVYSFEHFIAFLFLFFCWFPTERSKWSIFFVLNLFSGRRLKSGKHCFYHWWCFKSKWKENEVMK